MKKILSLPEHKEFFDRYAGVIGGITLFGIFCQIVSFFTELGIVYSFLYNKLNDILPALAQILAIGAALVISLAIELGLRSTAPKAVQAVLYKRWGGMDGIMNTGFIFVVTILLTMSTLFSFFGSKETVKNIVDDYQEATTEKPDSAYQVALSLVLDNYSRDSMQIVKSGQRQIASKEKYYNAKVEEKRGELKSYSMRETRTGKSYPTKKDAIRAQIKAIEAEKTDTLANIESRQSMSLDALLSSRNNDMTAVKAEQSGKVVEIKTRNAKGVAEIEGIEKNYGNGLAWITVVCIVLFFASVIFNQVFLKGSGITETVEPDNSFFEENVFAEWLRVTRQKLSVALKSNIRTWEAKTPPAPLPGKLDSLYKVEQTERIKNISAEEVLKYWAAIHAQSELKRKLKKDKKAAAEKDKLTDEEKDEYQKILEDISKGTADQKNGSAYEGKMPHGKRSKKLTIEEAVNSLLLSSEYENYVVLGDLDLAGIFRYNSPAFFHVGPKAKNGTWKGLLSCSNAKSKYKGLFNETKRKLDRLGDTGNGSKQTALERTLSGQYKSLSYWSSVHVILEGITKGKISEQEVDRINEHFRNLILEKTLKTA